MKAANTPRYRPTVPAERPLRGGPTRRRVPRDTGVQRDFPYQGPWLNNGATDVDKAL